MVFPFSVKYNKRLKAIITPNNQLIILEFITKSISEDKADNVVAGDSYVTYKGSTSNWRGSLFGSVDDGIFRLVYKDGIWWLNYQINMLEFLTFTTIFSLVVGIATLSDYGSWWISIAAFFLLCVVNLIPNLMRHEIVAVNIVQGIDDLICGKVIKPEQDKMTGDLKSWF